jgi:PKD repeat protein
MLKRQGHTAGSADRPARRRGQSLVEFALVLPILLLILMMGIDFGRIFLGWVNLNNTARIGANFAATNATLMAAGNPAAQAAYRNLIQQDATATNCALPNPIPDPTFPDGTALGQRAHVAITCKFGLITPIISNILGSVVSVSASSDFPIRTGIIAGVPGAPATVEALFNASPTTAVAPQTVTFTDFSTGNLTSYAWDFNGDGVVDSITSGNQTFLYTLPNTYNVKLIVSDGVTTSSLTKQVTITAPPGPVVAFTALPATGTSPLTVAFTNTSTGSGTLTYLWNFGDGSATSTQKVPPAHVYGTGTWTVTLTVTDGLSQSNSGQQTVTVNAPIPQCTVPNYKNVQTSNAVQTTWTTAGFDTTVIFNPARPPEYKITKQSLAAGSQKPCSGTVITVLDH